MHTANNAQTIQLCIDYFITVDSHSHLIVKIYFKCRLPSNILVYYFVVVYWIMFGLSATTGCFIEFNLFTVFASS